MLWRRPALCLTSRRLISSYEAAIAKADAAAAATGASATTEPASWEIKPQLDLRKMAERAAEMQQNAARRNMQTDVPPLFADWRSLQMQCDHLRHERKLNADAMKQARSAAERTPLIEAGKQLKQSIAELEARVDRIYADLLDQALTVPNNTHPAAPVGSEDKAVQVTLRGTKPSFAAGVTPLDHMQIGSRCDLFEFGQASVCTGPKFYYLKNEAALLEFALVQFALSKLVRRGFTPVTTPDLARHQVVSGCGFQPRGQATQVYSVANSDLCLIGTAEITLAGLLAGRVFTADELPLRFVGVSHCFRTEVGSAGAQVRGLYRVHQFTKAEMFVVCTPEQSDAMLEEIRGLQEEIFGDLGLHFRTLDMPTEELGAAAYRKYDVEAWMPGRSAFGEVSSSSNCTDYQARRLAIRVRHSGGGAQQQNTYAHTLNGTAVAVPRAIVALLETHQDPNGSGAVKIPDVLRPWMPSDMIPVRRQQSTSNT